MTRLLNELLSAYEKCLDIVDYGSEEKRRDTAFSMVRELLNARSGTLQNIDTLLIKVALHAVCDKSIIDNLVREVSSDTSLSINYSPYESVMVFLSSKSYFNLETIRYVSDAMEAEYNKNRGGSSMQESACNLPFYGFNRTLLMKCTNAAENSSNL